MQRRSRFVLAAAALVAGFGMFGHLSSPAVAQSPAPSKAVSGQTELLKVHDGTTVTVTEGTEVKVSLPGELNKGRRWIVEPMQGSIDSLQRDLDVSYIANSDGTAGGMFYCTFRATWVGKTTLTMRYVHSANTKTDLDTFTVDVNVVASRKRRAITQQDDGTVITVKSGTMLDLALPINGGVPYAWIPDVAGTTVEVYGHRFAGIVLVPIQPSQPMPPPVVGAPALSHQRFKTNGNGVSMIVSQLRFLGRPNGKAAGTPFSVTINVVP